MDTITATMGKGRQLTWEGRDYIVAPMTLLVPGVIHGSGGPLLYTPEILARNPAHWNGVPIVLYHPTLAGVPLSAQRVRVLERQGIGQVFNALMHDGKLRAEGWFDIQKTRAVDKRVLKALQAGTPLSVSTGLRPITVPAAAGAVYNTALGPQPYSGVVRYCRPDHLAVLPDQRGACSLEAGCGVFVGRATSNAR